MNSNLENSTSAISVHPDLKKHAEMLSKVEVIKVTDQVYVAIGFALANMIMVEGDDGIVIIDTTESEDSALKILEEFRKITQKPIKGIILTHFHADHVNGTHALLQTTENEGKDVKVIAHSTFYEELMKSMLMAESNINGAVQQFGTILQKGTEVVCCGIGPFLVTNIKGRKLVKPTHTFEKEAIFTIAGVNFNVMHTPGETDDQITVWIPEWKVVMPADNIYKTFPNLYAIRGSPPRNTEKWFCSLDKVRRLGAAYMVPSHTEPVEGDEKIFDIITFYRDAIQFVNDQTIRFMNNGLDIDDIIEKVRLPADVASHPYLQEHYGMVCWSVRNVANLQSGWFDKKPTNLFPLSDKSKAKYINKLVQKSTSSLVDGVELMLAEAESLLKISNHQANSRSDGMEEEALWSLKLSLHVLDLLPNDSPFYERAVSASTSGYKYLASITKNPNARNYFLVKSKSIRKPEAARVAILMQKIKRIPFWPIDWLMKRLRFSVRAECCHDKETFTVLFSFPDVDQIHSYTLRHCILEYHDSLQFIPSKFDVKVSLNSEVWKQLLTNEKSLTEAKDSKQFEIEGKIEILERFMNLSEMYVPNVISTLKTRL